LHDDQWLSIVVEKEKKWRMGRLFKFSLAPIDGKPETVKPSFNDPSPCSR
jgi:hypothetical protein